MGQEDAKGTLRQMLGGLHNTGTTLIKRGTAMGPLIPVLALVPILGFFSWLFIGEAVIGGVPIFSALCFIGITVIIGHYLWNYSSFASRDPDRLQSEQYRTRMQQLQVQLIVAKDLPEPLLADVLETPTPNPSALEVQDDSEDNSPMEPREEQPS